MSGSNRYSQNPQSTGYQNSPSSSSNNSIRGPPRYHRGDAVPPPSYPKREREDVVGGPTQDNRASPNAPPPPRPQSTYRGSGYPHAGADGQGEQYPSYRHYSPQQSTGYGHPKQQQYPYPAHNSYPGMQQQQQQQPVYFSPTAPRLEVRGDLPIDAVSLIDLLAFYVAKSGPTVEEEIIYREEANPQFDFITAPARESPQNVYYRWRVYSLLQGDTMTQWRTHPFQMEQHPEAYIWVPPPIPVSGPACLYPAYEHLRGWLRAQMQRGNCDNQSPDSPAPASAGLLPSPTRAGEGGATPETATATVPAPCAYPPPSAYWLSRSATGEGNAFGTLSAEDTRAWEAMLDPSSVLEDSFQKASDSDAHAVDFEKAVTAAGEALLSTTAIAEKMVFAVEHAQVSVNGMGGAAPHVASLLLDTSVKLAYDAAHLLTQCAMRRKEDEGQQRSPAASAIATRLALLCVAQLAQLFLLHDIVQNVKAVPLFTDEQLQAAEAQLEVEEEQRKAAKALQALAGGSSGSGGGGGGGHVVNAPVLPTTSAAAAAAAAASATRLALSSSAPAPGVSLPLASASAVMAPAAATTSFRSVKCIMHALENILPTALEAVTLTGLAAIAMAHEHDPSAVSRLRVVLEEGGLGLPSDGGGFPADPAGAAGYGLQGGGRTVVSLMLNGEAPPSDAEKARQVGEMLLTWLSQFLCVWSNRDCAALKMSSGGEDGSAEVVAFRGRAMVLLLEKYDWLLPRTTR